MWSLVNWTHQGWEFGVEKCRLTGLSLEVVALGFANGRLMLMMLAPGSRALEKHRAADAHDARGPLKNTWRLMLMMLAGP